jgi:hypothetical protein
LLDALGLRHAWRIALTFTLSRLPRPEIVPGNWPWPS